MTLTKSGQNVADFEIMANNCANATLGPGASCTLFVTFDPGAVGGRSATLTASAAPGGSAATNLSGTCTP